MSLFGGASFSFNFQKTEQGELQAQPQTCEETPGPLGLRPAEEVVPWEESAFDVDESHAQVETIRFSEDVFLRKLKLSDAFLRSSLQGMEAQKGSSSSSELGSTSTVRVSDVLGHSDLLSGVYEGGFKQWECSVDLVHFLMNEMAHKEDASTSPMRVLELGCGQSLPALYMLKYQEATVHFQDYNTEVLRLLTIPNTLLNCGAGSVSEKRLQIQKQKEKEGTNLVSLTDSHKQFFKERDIRFFAGDWQLLETMIEKQSYDMILTSETIYNTQNLAKLYSLIKHALKPSGVCFAAAKTYYFAVGGGCRQFENIVKEDGFFDISTARLIDDGTSNRREILKLTRSSSQ
ncbi:Histidine protein methyltransferase 1 [Balamuthia mandrillaris]